MGKTLGWYKYKGKVVQAEDYDGNFVKVNGAWVHKSELEETDAREGAAGDKASETVHNGKPAAQARVSRKAPAGRVATDDATPGDKGKNGKGKAEPKPPAGKDGAGDSDTVLEDGK